MRSNLILAWFFVFIHGIACKQTSAPKTNGNSTTPTEPSRTETTNEPPQCQAPCRLLADYTLADLQQGTYQALCQAKTQYINTLDCDQIDLYRNCVYANNGKIFRKEKWQSIFRSMPWYKPKENVSAQTFSVVERNNIRALKDESLSCRNRDDAGRQTLLKRKVPGGSEENEVIVYPDGTLDYGKLKGKVGLEGVDVYPTVLDEEGSIHRFKFDKTSNQHVIQVALPMDSSDDIGKRYQLFIENGVELMRIMCTSYDLI